MTGEPTAIDDECDNDVGPTCFEHWPQDPASWCDGCRAKHWHDDEPELDPPDHDTDGTLPE